MYLDYKFIPEDKVYGQEAELEISISVPVEGEYYYHEDKISISKKEFFNFLGDSDD